MASFFFSRNKTKTPTDLVKHTRDLLPKLWEPSSSQKVQLRFLIFLEPDGTDTAYVDGGGAGKVAVTDEIGATGNTG